MNHEQNRRKGEKRMVRSEDGEQLYGLIGGYAAIVGRLVNFHGK